MPQRLPAAATPTAQSGGQPLAELHQWEVPPGLELLAQAVTAESRAERHRTASPPGSPAASSDTLSDGLTSSNQAESDDGSSPSDTPAHYNMSDSSPETHPAGNERPTDRQALREITPGRVPGALEAAAEPHAAQTTDRLTAVRHTTTTAEPDQNAPPERLARLGQAPAQQSSNMHARLRAVQGVASLSHPAMVELRAFCVSLDKVCISG